LLLQYQNTKRDADHILPFGFLPYRGARTASASLEKRMEALQRVKPDGYVRSFQNRKCRLDLHTEHSVLALVRFVVAVPKRTGRQMIVLDYYNLQEQPFGVTPDSRYLFLNPTHKEALASLIYGIEAGCGFVALISTPGLGKTTLLFQTLDILREKARIVFLFQTIGTPLDLLRALLSGLGVRDLQGSLVEMQLKLKDILTEQYRQGKRVVLVIDEAQNLDDSVLELVRMLSNFETARDKLIQIILSGRPQLADNMGSPELLQYGNEFRYLLV
jgi:type II secretory pathway predicted ATPase ExeA